MVVNGYPLMSYYPGSKITNGYLLGCFITFEVQEFYEHGFAFPIKTASCKILVKSDHVNRSHTVVTF